MQHDNLIEIECELIDLAGLADALLLSAHHVNDHNGRTETADFVLAANALPVMARTLKARLEAAHDRILEMAREEKARQAGGRVEP